MAASTFARFVATADEPGRRQQPRGSRGRRRSRRALAEGGPRSPGRPPGTPAAARASNSPRAVADDRVRPQSEPEQELIDRPLGREDDVDGDAPPPRARGLGRRRPLRRRGARSARSRSPASRAIRSDVSKRARTSGKCGQRSASIPGYCDPSPGKRKASFGAGPRSPLAPRNTSPGRPGSTGRPGRSSFGSRDPRRSARSASEATTRPSRARFSAGVTVIDSRCRPGPSEVTTGPERSQSRSVRTRAARLARSAASIRIASESQAGMAPGAPSRSEPGCAPRGWHGR